MTDVAEFSGWPSGDCKPVLEIGFSPQEAESKWGLDFKRNKDDLDWYLGAHVYDPYIGYMVFIRYANSPTPGTVVYVDSGIATSDAEASIREKFDIKESDILWKSTET